MTVVDAWYMFNDTDHLMKFYSPDCEVYQTLCEGLKEACNIDSLAPIYYGALPHDRQHPAEQRF